MTFSIRPMLLEDIDAVHAIELEGHKAPWSRDIVHDCVMVGYDCRIIEFEEENKRTLVGYAICRQSFNVCHILNLCVAPAYQRKGIGKMLLDNLIKSPVSPLINSFILEVRPSNKAALALYEQMGFEHDSVKSEYYTDSHGVEDAWMLKKTL